MRFLFVLLLWFSSVFGLLAQNNNPFELFSPEDQKVDSTSLANQINKSSLLEEVNSVSDTLLSDTKIQSTPHIVQENPSEEITKIPTNPFELTANPYRSNNNQDTNTILNETLIATEQNTSDTLTNINSSTSENISSSITPPTKRTNSAFWIALISGLLLSVLLTTNRTVLKEISKSLKNINYMKLFQKEEKNGRSISFIFLSVIFILNFSVFLRTIFIAYEIPVLQYNLWFIFILVTTILILRHLSLSILSFLRKKLPEATSYGFIIIMVNSIIGLILIPINLIIAFGPEEFQSKTIILGVIIILLGFLLKWLSGFLNSVRIILGDSFHFLLYLCTCEIIPILICIGFIRNLIN